MATIIQFDTARLRLRQWRGVDRAAFAALNSDPQVMACFPAPLDRAASDALADRLEAFIDEHGWGFWAVEMLHTGEFVGTVGLQRCASLLPFAPCVEIGWRLAFQYWGKGLAAEAAMGALQVGFEMLDLPEIVAFTAVINERSRAVMERLGMNDDGTFEHPQVPEGHVLRAHVLYRLSREKYRGLYRRPTD